MESVLLLKNELLIAVVIFLLLFIKIGKGLKNESLLTLVQVLLFVNVALGFLFNKDGSVFSGMFYTNAVIAFQKNIERTNLDAVENHSYLRLLLRWLIKQPRLVR